MFQINTFKGLFCHLKLAEYERHPLEVGAGQYQNGFLIPGDDASVDRVLNTSTRVLPKSLGDTDESTHCCRVSKLIKTI